MQEERYRNLDPEDIATVLSRFVRLRYLKYTATDDSDGEVSSWFTKLLVETAKHSLETLIITQCESSQAPCNRSEYLSNLKEFEVLKVLQIDVYDLGAKTQAFIPENILPPSLESLTLDGRVLLDGIVSISTKICKAKAQHFPNLRRVKFSCVMPTYCDLEWRRRTKILAQQCQDDFGFQLCFGSVGVERTRPHWADGELMDFD